MANRHSGAAAPKRTMQRMLDRPSHYSREGKDADGAHLHALLPMCSPQRPNVGRDTEEFGCCTARANDDNSTFLNGRGAGECGFGGKRLRKWHGNHRLNNGGKCSSRNEEERARRRVAGSPPPLLTDLDRSPPAPLFCTSRAKRRFFPSSLSSSLPPPGTDPIETRAAQLPWRRRRRRPSLKSYHRSAARTHERTHGREIFLVSEGGDADPETTWRIKEASPRFQRSCPINTAEFELERHRVVLLRRSYIIRIITGEDRKFWRFGRSSVMAVGPLLAQLGTSASVRPSIFVMWTMAA